MNKHINYDIGDFKIAKTWEDTHAALGIYYSISKDILINFSKDIFINENTILIYRSSEDKEIQEDFMTDLLNVLEHESLHKLLDQFINLEVCRLLDNKIKGIRIETIRRNEIREELKNE